MSWLARSFANSLRLDEEEEDDDEDESVGIDAAADSHQKSSTPTHDSLGNAYRVSLSIPEDEAHARGVKDDLTELGNTLTRQFRGVANFLAPAPDARAGSSFDLSDPDLNQSRPSLRSESCDTPETGNRDRSSNSEPIALCNRSEENALENMCSDPEEDEEYGGEEDESDEEEEIDAAALTDEVLAFARNIAMHPETWLDFPLDPDEDLDDLQMSDAQRGHVLAIERLAPRLAALRIELCPCHMTVGYFWKVYFVLLHSRLNKPDADILSSPQVMEARALWMKELSSQTQSGTDLFGRSNRFLKDDIVEEDTTPSTSNYYAPPEFLSPRIYAFEPPSIMYRDFETVKRISENTDQQFIDKAVIEEKPIQKKIKAHLLNHVNDDDDDDDDDVWPEEEDSNYNGCTWAPQFTVNEDDVSFSDLEGDDDISSLALKSLKATQQKGT